MLDAPQQDWSLYESLTRDADAAWMRSLTPQQRLETYASLFNLIHQSRDPASDAEQLERRRWEEKLALRQRLSEAFAQWDQRRRDRSTENHAS